MYPVPALNRHVHLLFDTYLYTPPPKYTSPKICRSSLTTMAMTFTKYPIVGKWEGCSLKDCDIHVHVCPSLSNLCLIDYNF